MIKGKKPDVKKLLEKGKLSGWELGRLILMDNVEADHGRPVILSKEDVRAIQRRLDQLEYKDAQDFNRLQNLYKILSYTILEGKIAGLEAMNTLSTASHLLQRFHIEGDLRDVLMWMLPAIVTKKQYEEAGAREREFKLSELKSLRDVLEALVHEQAPPEAAERWRNPGEGETNFLYLTDFLADSLQEEDRAIVTAAAEELIRLIREGVIQPVLLLEKAIKKMKKMERDQDDREADVEAGAVPLDIQKKWAEWKKSRAALRASYEAGKAKMTAEKAEAIIKLLERVADHSYLLGWGDPEDDLIEYSYCTGREEYEAGVKWWIEFVDTYQGNLEPGSLAREDIHSMMGVAILQDPPAFAVEERGYFNDAASRTLTSISTWKYTERIIQETYSRKIAIPDFLKAQYQAARQDILKFVSIKVVIEAASIAVGVDFAEDLREMERRVEKDVEIYNSLTQPTERTLLDGQKSQSEPPHYLGIPKLKALKIGKLKPPAKSLQYYKERIDLSLGDGWVQKIVDAVDFEAEEGSLAQEVVIMAWASGIRKEHGHGQK